MCCGPDSGPPTRSRSGQPPLVTSGEDVISRNANSGPTSMTQSTIEVLPEDNPYRPMVTPDRENESDGNGYEVFMIDGLGDDDDGDDDDDEESGDWGGDSNVRPKRKRHALVEWLRLAFEQRRVEARQRGPDGLPVLYRDNKTFWFPRPSAFFLLKYPNLTPQLLFNPRFFLWDPLPLCPDGIPCPNCKHPLSRHCEIDRLRRCIDQHDYFWIIGYRYICHNCVTTSGKSGVTFRSWDKRILDVLPRALAVEFPAMMSHRSAISTASFSTMRMCIQNGMGSKQFSDTLRAQHLEHYDIL
ncbi:hypothetical protein AN958_01227 [Leucoagaricus sp. SymC.cos]|nr:hypothetical protein AN958_01227 [Leucoagaricus sp. SymC.cos]